MLGKLIGQLSGLTVIQAMATLLPLLVVPHLMLTVGASGFGNFNKALLASSLLIPVLDMGFDLYAARQLARKESQMNQLLGLHLQQRILMIFPAGVFFIALTFSIPDFRVISDLMLFGLLYAFITSLLPNWYFEGNKRFHIVQWSALSWKIIYTVLILWWVRQPEHESWVMAFNAAGGLAVLLFYLLKMRMEGVRPVWVSWKEVISSLRKNAPIFVTPMTTYLVTFVPSLIVSFLLTPLQFGYYAVVDRVLQIFRLPASMLSTVVYVQYNELLKAGRRAFQNFYITVTLLVLGGGMLGVGLLLLIETLILGLLTAGQIEAEVVLPYRILLWSGVFIIQRNHLQKLLLAFNLERALARVSIIALLMMPFLFYFAHEWGGDKALYFSMLLYELLFVSLLSWFSIKGIRALKVEV